MCSSGGKEVHVHCVHMYMCAYVLYAQVNVNPSNPGEYPKYPAPQPAQE